jgi:hypothetical protein
VSYYRAAHVPQVAADDCRLAVGCTHLDFHTQGAQTCYPDLMRSHQQRLGQTEPDDLRRAWMNGHGVQLLIGSGYWADLEALRRKGKFVELDVWVGFPHTIGIAPDTSKGRWLVSDPRFPDWQWFDPYAIAETAWLWGMRVRRMPHEPLGATLSPDNPLSGTMPHFARLRGVAASDFGPMYWTTS